MADKEKFMVSNKPVTLPDERGRFGDFGGKFVPERLMAALAFAARLRRVDALGGYRGGVYAGRIKHRDKNSASTQNPEISLVATQTALLPKVPYMACPTVF
jgi:hypothetical protein